MHMKRGGEEHKILNREVIWGLNYGVIYIIFSSENCMSFHSELSFRNGRSITLEK